MGGARALIASLGASISLVAGAAVSLLFFSVVFALPGITGGADAPGASAAVVVDSKPLRARSTSTAAAREASTSVLISAPRPASRRPAARRASVVRRRPAETKPSFRPDLRDLRPPAARTEAAPTETTTSQPALGDGVRDVGDVVTATVQGTGKAAAPLLGPPVSQAIQDVLDLLASVVQGATGALGGALDKAVPR